MLCVRYSGNIVLPLGLLAWLVTGQGVYAQQKKKKKGATGVYAQQRVLPAQFSTV